MTRLTDMSCKDLPAGSPALDDAAVRRLLAQVHDDWSAADGRLTRTFAVEGYPPAHMLANAIAFLAEREGHHPDVSFGWGWCKVTWWTHSVGGLSENDFICAAKLDALVAG